MNSKPVICLAMLVRDEAATIQRCLSAALPVIDRYYIIDTGSTDDTISIIRNELKSLPGEIVKYPFSSFSILREKLYQEAGDTADYVLMLDADETLQSKAPEPITTQSIDIGLMEVQTKHCSYIQPRLFRSGCNIHCIGYVNERAIFPSDFDTLVLPEICIYHHQDGFRSKQASTNTNDIAHLYAELGTGDRDSEILLRLGAISAQSDDPERASLFFKQCVDNTTDDNIAWHAYYANGKLLEQQEDKSTQAIESFLRAFDLYPDRVEPLAHLIKIQQEIGDPKLAGTLSEVAASIELPWHTDYFERSLYSPS